MGGGLVSRQMMHAHPVARHFWTTKKNHGKPCGKRTTFQKSGAMGSSFRTVLACALAALAAGATYREHLDILGLKPGASEKDITQAYRRGLRRLRPNVGQF
jgi:hypothetical protein